MGESSSTQYCHKYITLSDIKNANVSMYNQNEPSRYLKGLLDTIKKHTPSPIKGNFPKYDLYMQNFFFAGKEYRFYYERIPQTAPSGEFKQMGLRQSVERIDAINQIITLLQLWSLGKVDATSICEISNILKRFAKPEDLYLTDYPELNNKQYCELLNSIDDSLTNYSYYLINEGGFIDIASNSIDVIDKRIDRFPKKYSPYIQELFFNNLEQLMETYTGALVYYKFYHQLPSTIEQLKHNRICNTSNIPTNKNHAVVPNVMEQAIQDYESDRDAHLLPKYVIMEMDRLWTTKRLPYELSSFFNTIKAYLEDACFSNSPVDSAFANAYLYTLVTSFNGFWSNVLDDIKDFLIKKYILYVTPDNVTITAPDCSQKRESDTVYDHILTRSEFQDLLYEKWYDNYPDYTEHTAMTLKIARININPKISL